MACYIGGKYGKCKIPGCIDKTGIETKHHGQAHIVFKTSFLTCMSEHCDDLMSNICNSATNPSDGNQFAA